jgi:hypothetical protein
MLSDIMSQWPTPSAVTDAKGGTPEGYRARSLRNKNLGPRVTPTILSIVMQMTTAQWPTPNISTGDIYAETPEEWELRNARLREANPRLGELQKHLGTVMQAAQWPAPTVGDSKMARNSGANRSPGSKHHSGTTLTDAMMAQWPAPTVADVEAGRKTRSGARSGEMLLNGLMSQWPAPTVMDGGNGNTPEAWAARCRRNPNLGVRTFPSDLSVAMQFPTGPTPTGSTAQTERKGAPNPVFACWLMQWPDELTFGALQAIQSFRASRRKSSRRSSKAEA